MAKLGGIWDRSQDGNKKTERSFVRWVIISSAIFFVLVGFLNHDNLVRWIKAGFDIRHQNRQIEYYQQEIEKMELQIRALKDNPDSLESYAREQFGFCEPGEEVYIDKR